MADPATFGWEVARSEKATFGWEVARSEKPGHVQLTMAWHLPDKDRAGVVLELPMADALKLGLELSDAALAESRAHR